MAEMLKVLVTVIMENHLYQFDGRLYQQQNAEGGTFTVFMRILEKYENNLTNNLQKKKTNV